MQPSEPAQFLVSKGLDTETQSIDSRRAKPVKGFPRGGFRIGLESDFGVCRQNEAVAASLNDARDFARFQKRRRSAAEKNCVRVNGWIRRAADVGNQGLDISPPQIVVM